MSCTVLKRLDSGLYKYNWPYTEYSPILQSVSVSLIVEEEIFLPHWRHSLLLCANYVVFFRSTCTRVGEGASVWWTKNWYTSCMCALSLHMGTFTPIRLWISLSAALFCAKIWKQYDLYVLLQVLWGNIIDENLFCDAVFGRQLIICCQLSLIIDFCF